MNGPVVIDFPIPRGELVIFRSYSVSAQGQIAPDAAIGVDTMEDMIQTITGGGGLREHPLDDHPGGEIRGQLRLRHRS